MSASQDNQKHVITLDYPKSIQILVQYNELAQTKGAFVLNEADIIKRSVDVLVNQSEDDEIKVETAVQVLIQGVNKGQKHGAFTLNDASLLSKVIQFILEFSKQNKMTQLQAQQPQSQQPQSQVQPQAVETKDEIKATIKPKIVEEDDFDLSELAEPLPLKPREI